MSSNAITPTTNPLTEMVANLTRRYDTDGDSKLSTDEFGSFLSDLLSGAGGQGNSTFAAGTAATLGTLEGFDPAKLGNPSHMTMKYQVGRILQQYPNTPQGLRDALPTLQSLAPGVTISGTAGDKLDFGTFVDGDNNRLGIIDVLRGAHAGGQAWQWSPASPGIED
jgi:hypothetical protein